MVHSVEAYLARQSTELLEGALQNYCGSKERLCSNSGSVGAILKELKKRYNAPDGELPAHVKAAWEAYQRHLAELADV